MFRTFRVRLLFWFLVFISSSFIIMMLSLAYQQEREAIFSRSEAIDQAYLSLLKLVQTQQDFFTYDTKNGSYFKTGDSDYLDQYAAWRDSTQSILAKVDFREAPDLQQQLAQQQEALLKVDSVFTDLTTKIKVRGFKDYSLEGAMRDDAHELENAVEIPREKVLSLRRHEKDYIIRNEIEYVQKLNAVVAEITQGLKANYRITPARRASLLQLLEDYQSKFSQLVELDREIGIKNNSGLKLNLDTRIRSLEAGFSGLVAQTGQRARQEFSDLGLYLTITVVLLVIISIIISAFIATRITRPLTDLTQYITRFVKSDFTLDKEHPVVKSKDEIGSLTRNFSILKDEVVTQMTRFKQRVKERTQELADANAQLVKVSEANSRFVPKEFLKYLGKEGIEQIKLGDQVEREMTVLFTDIRSFTKISEALNPQENFDFLNSYLKGIVPIILKHGGFIDKFIGDSVMALFPDSPDGAIRAVIEFEDFMKEFNVELAKNPKIPEVIIGSGIHTGSMILGTIGHDNRLETTVISDAVNTAARIEGLTKHYDTPVIFTEDTLKSIQNKADFHYRFLDKVKVKGKSQTLSVYQYLLPQETLKISYIDRYNEAMDLLREEEIPKACEILTDLAKRNLQDKAVRRFLEKYREYTNEDWQEATEMTTK